MEIDKIKRVVLGKASWEEREGVRLWMEGSKAREIKISNVSLSC